MRVNTLISKMIVLTAAVVLALFVACFAPTPATSYAATNTSGIKTFAASSSPIKAPSTTMPVSSIYCWTPPYAFAPETANGELFRALNIKRVYQSFGGKYPKVLQSQETVNAISNLNSRGIEVYLLCGEPKWAMVEKEMEKATSRIDAIKKYNQGIGAKAQIKGIIFDIESFTSDEWKALEATQEGLGFRTYVDNMKKIYNYAKANNVRVIQCIPRWLENRSASMLEELIRDCCDEVSVMNYYVGSEVKDISTEVALCKKYGKPIESIFNTMPPNGGTITNETTYFNRTFKDLFANWNKVEQAYGKGAIGMSYHHLENLVPVLTSGGKIAHIYAYTSSSDPTRNSYNQTSALKSIVLKGSDGSVITAGMYYPSLPLATSESAFLAIGIKPGVTYTVESGDPQHYKVLTKTPKFLVNSDSPTLSTTIMIAPGVEVTKVANGLVAQVKIKTLTVKYGKLKKKNKSIAKTQAFKITKANGAVTFKKLSGNKKITVSKAGKLTVKKGLKKGTYKVLVEVSAAGDANHFAASKSVTLKIKVA